MGKHCVNFKDGSGVYGTTDKRFPNSCKIFEFYATQSLLFLLTTMYGMENVSDIMDLLILWRFDALFGCGERIVESLRGLASASLRKPRKDIQFPTSNFILLTLYF